MAINSLRPVSETTTTAASPAAQLILRAAVSSNGALDESVAGKNFVLEGVLKTGGLSALFLFLALAIAFYIKLFGCGKRCKGHPLACFSGSNFELTSPAPRRSAYIQPIGQQPTIGAPIAPAFAAESSMNRLFI